MTAEFIKDLSILGHLIDYCNDIEDTINYFGDDFIEFQNNRIYKHSISMCVMQIGELTKSLSLDFRNNHPEMTWKDAIGMRNLFAHGYWEMNEELIWKAIHNNTNVLKNICKEVLAENQDLIDIHLFGEREDKLEELESELDDDLEL